ncbi:MAG TPA: DUF2934 domain-containing protein [Burkholderiales bacterium]|nr:DUF2934 domain-containing protein [Burkholderiales bacterium]
MDTIESSPVVLHRGREAPELLQEETAELLEQTQEQMPAPDERERMIAEAAYYRAEKRGFAPGHELEDWLEAEAELRVVHPWQ